MNDIDPKRVREWVPIYDVKHKTTWYGSKYTELKDTGQKRPVFHTVDDQCQWECKDNQDPECNAKCAFMQCMMRHRGSGIPQCTFWF